MATAKRSAKKKISVPEDENGNPDIYAMMRDQELTVDEAAEAAGITGMKAWRLSIVQEVEHNPEERCPERVLKNKTKLGQWVANKRDDEKMRWEKLMARTGLSKTELQEIYEETTGEAAKRLRGGPKSEDEDGEAKPKAKRGRKAKAKAEPEPEPEDDDEDDTDLDEEDEDDEAEVDLDDDEDEDEPEEAKPAPKRRARLKK